MKTTLQKMICLSICVAMLLVLFAGCGKEPVSSPTDITPENVVTPLDREPVEDTTTVVSKVEASNPSSSKLPTSSVAPPSNGSSGGEIIKFPVSPKPVTSSTPSKEEPKPISIVFRSIYADQYTGETGMGKLWKDHFGKMAEQGILTSYANLDPDTAVDTIFKEVLAGRASADVYEVSLAISHQLAVKKVLANVLDSKTLNQKAFNNGGTHSNTINGKTYGVALAANGQVSMILYNKELIKRYAPDVDIPALISQNKWNYDTFRDLAKKCTVDTDGDSKKDIYGVTATTQLIQGVLFAAGGYGVMKQGKITSTLADKGEGYDALEFAKTLFKTDRSWKYLAKEQDQWAWFSNQKTAMTVISSRGIPAKAKEVSFAYGIAPIPTQDQATACNGVMDAQVFVVPKTKENRLDNIGKWLNGVAKAENSVFINQTYGMHNEAVNTYQRILKNTSAEYSAGAISLEFASRLDAMVTTSGGNAKKALAAIHLLIQNQLDEFYAPLYEK